MNTEHSDWIFTYGANMDLAALQHFFRSEEFYDARILFVEPARLDGYQLVWNYYSPNRNGGAANIERAPERNLPGLLLCVNEQAQIAIDWKEGNGSYYDRGKQKIAVSLLRGGELQAWVYAAAPKRISSRIEPPRQTYLNVLLAAAERYQLPDWYRAELAATPVRELSRLS